MKKLFCQNIFALSAEVILAVGGLFAGALQVSAEISGRQLSADVGAADLSIIASKWPYLLLIGAIIIVLLYLVNVFYRIKEKK